MVKYSKNVGSPGGVVDGIYAVIIGKSISKVMAISLLITFSILIIFYFTNHVQSLIMERLKFNRRVLSSSVSVLAVSLKYYAAKSRENKIVPHI